MLRKLLDCAALALDIEVQTPSATMNISSVIVYAVPAQLGTVKDFLASLPGLECHAQTDDGKLVVTIETHDNSAATAIYEAIERVPGVLSVALVFQQTESTPDQELTPCK